MLDRKTIGAVVKVAAVTWAQERWAEEVHALPDPASSALLSPEAFRAFEERVPVGVLSAAEAAVLWSVFSGLARVEIARLASRN